VSKWAIFPRPVPPSFFDELLPKLMALGQVEITALRVNEMAVAFEIAVRRESYYGFFTSPTCRTTTSTLPAGN